MATTTHNNIEQLQKTLHSVKNFKTGIYVEREGVIEKVEVTSDEYCKFIRSYLFVSPGCLMSKHAGHDNIAEAFAQISNVLNGAKIFPATVTVESENANLDLISRRAWCEALGSPDAESSEGSNPDQSRELILRDNLWKKLTGGVQGVQRWNAVDSAGRRLINWSNSKLTGAKLKGADLSSINLTNACFDRADLDNAILPGSNISRASFCGASLIKTSLIAAKAEGANFTEAILKYAKLDYADLRDAVFKNTDLTKADLQSSNLRSVDLTTANLTNARFDYAEYDQTTVLPTDFLQWSTLRWCGSAPDPYKKMVAQKIKELVVANFDEMVAQVKLHFDPSRLDKVFKMLKKERFELFSETEDSFVTGVVKSQTDPDLLYACSLNAKGGYTCCTQNLRPCGGLKGAICKHILVLVLGLARANKIDLSAATKWILTSIDKNPSTNKSAMTEVFLKYQSAVTGEIDWRPTETVPEDYYSF